MEKNGNAGIGKVDRNKRLRGGRKFQFENARGGETMSVYLETKFRGEERKE